MFCDFNQATSFCSLCLNIKVVHTVYWINILFQTVESISPIGKKTSPARGCLGTKYAFVWMKGHRNFNVILRIITERASVVTKRHYVNAFKLSIVIQPMYPWLVTLKDWYKVFIHILADIKCYFFIHVISIGWTSNCDVAFTDGGWRWIKLSCEIPYKNKSKTSKKKSCLTYFSEKLFDK